MARFVRPSATVGAFESRRDERVDRLVELVLGDGAVDQAPIGGLAARHLPPEQEQLLRARDADEARHEPGRATVGRETALEEGLPEAGSTRLRP